MILTGAGIFVLIFLGGSPILVLAGLMTGCGHGFLYPCLNALAVRDEPVNIRGKVIGIFTGGLDAGLFIGAITLGYIGESAGFQALFLAGGLAFLAGLGVYKLWPQTPPAFFQSPQNTEDAEDYEKPL
jgi:MFS family permease